jgi:hypothetical protein
MDSPAHAIGQAVFIRTDSPDYAEETIAFKSLADMVKVCSTAYPNMSLERVIIYSLVENEPVALTLAFMAATRGQRPAALEFAAE